MGHQQAANSVSGLWGLAIFLGFERVHRYLHSIGRFPRRNEAHHRPGGFPLKDSSNLHDKESEGGWVWRTWASLR